MRHNITHRIYRYEEPLREMPNLNEHSLIMKVQPMGPGFIYPKELSSLDKQLLTRKHVDAK